MLKTLRFLFCLEHILGLTKLTTNPNTNTLKKINYLFNTEFLSCVYLFNFYIFEKTSVKLTHTSFKTSFYILSLT